MPGMRGSAMSGATDTTAGKRHLDDLHHVFQRALDLERAVLGGNLRGGGDHGQAQLGSQLHVHLLRVVVGGAVAAEDDVEVAHLGNEFGERDGGGAGVKVRLHASSAVMYSSSTPRASTFFFSLESSMSAPPTVTATTFEPSLAAAS